MEERDTCSKYYLHLFNAVTDEVGRLEDLIHAVPQGDFETIRDIAIIAHALKKAQRVSENLYIMETGEDGLQDAT